MPSFDLKRRSKHFSGSGPADISVLLKMVLDKNKISDDMTFSTLCERFSEVVGDLILPHVKLVSLEKNILVLKAANSAWKQELFLQKKAIIDKCNLVLGKPAVRDIRLV
ncbi:DUF721 domain-containing protein [Fibrobacter sp. UWEL]|uniref:DUF721 domain-containing protein n=1 Tax=Fibrobacter sp. UWEL TaxID=1896209 RepID=UPI0009155A12|nr:DUF721 domain-containing protein [Fibrobacter sp. UWEL]SHL10402.1 Protein of unknown function [Fibrobacter sp. UWEL]